jgi:hypothetical protein
MPKKAEYKCVICGVPFKSEEKLKHHMQIVHGTTDVPSNDAPKLLPHPNPPPPALPPHAPPRGPPKRI